MARHEEAPVAPWGSKDEAVDTFLRYVVYRETVDDTNRGAPANDHKAFRTLCDLVGIDRDKLPVVPTPPAREPRDIPRPRTSTSCSTPASCPAGAATPENQLLRYVLAFSFAFGVRTPSEVVTMSVDDLHFDTGEITITEPKKSGRRRRLLVDPRGLLGASNTMSLSNWLTWRDKIDPDTDQLFPRMDRKARKRKQNLFNWLRVRVLDKFPWWYPKAATGGSTPA
jgi:integrase